MYPLNTCKIQSRVYRLVHTKVVMEIKKIQQFIRETKNYNGYYAN